MAKLKYYSLQWHMILQKSGGKLSQNYIINFENKFCCLIFLWKPDNFSEFTDY